MHVVLCVLGRVACMWCFAYFVRRGHACGALCTVWGGGNACGALRTLRGGGNARMWCFAYFEGRGKCPHVVPCILRGEGAIHVVLCVL